MTGAIMKTMPRYLAAIVVTVILSGGSFDVMAWQKAEGKNMNKSNDGQRDFDFEIGVWKTRLKRLVNPLSGSTTWVEYEGTTIVRKVWNGDANLVELKVEGPTGQFEGLSLRLYNPQSGQWSLNFANKRSGEMVTPSIGRFVDGRGVFTSQETLNGRPITVRFVIIPVTRDSCLFEQAFSDDGGKTWEINWLATDTRIKQESDR